MQKTLEIKVDESLLKCSLCSEKLAAYSSETVFPVHGVSDEHLHVPLLEFVTHSC